MTTNEISKVIFCSKTPLTIFFVLDFIAKNCPNYKVFIIACRHLETFVYTKVSKCLHAIIKTL